MKQSTPLVTLLFVLLSILVTGCAAPLASSAEPANPRVLTVYARVIEVTRDVEMELVREFEEQHNVRVNLVTGEDPDLFAKFVVEKENGLESADVLAGWNPVGTLDLQERGFLEPYVPPELEARIPEPFRDTVVIQHVGLVTLAYSPAKLGDTPPPASFADLVKPEYRDRVAMVDPVISSTALTLVGHLAYSTPLGWDYWEQLHANGLRLVGRWDQLPAEIIDPDSPVAVVIAGYGLAMPAMKRGEPIQVVIPEEGLIAGEYVVAVAADATHPELARAFVEEVTFHPRLLAAWSNQYLPVTVEGVEQPEGTPPLERIVITDWRLIQEKELEIKTRWQIIQSE